MNLCVNLQNITKKEKLKQQHQVQFLNHLTFHNQANNKLKNVESAQQVIKKEDKLKPKVQMRQNNCLKNQNKIPNKFKSKNRQKNPKRI